MFNLLKKKKVKFKAVRESASPINLAIYTTYCGVTKRKTFKEKTYSKYPSFFLSNSNEVLSQAEDLGWSPLFLDKLEPSSDPIISATQAKIAKVVPHQFAELSQFDFLLYLDDKVEIDESKIAELVENLESQQSPLAMRKHPFLPPNVLFECTEALLQKRYLMQKEMMLNYITEQLWSGLKVTAEHLYWTSVILRNMRHRDTIDINNMWYEHIHKCGIECQVSFFFVAQRFSNISLLPDYLTNN